MQKETVQSGDSFIWINLFVLKQIDIYFNVTFKSIPDSKGDSYYFSYSNCLN